MSSTFISNASLKLAKDQSKAQQIPEAELLLFENYSLSSSTLSPTNNRRYSKKCIKNKHACLNEIIRWMTMKMRLKMKNISHTYDINRPRLRHGHIYTKYKMCLNIMMVICIKQHLSNIWSSFHKKVKKHCGWVEKSAAYKKRCISNNWSRCLIFTLIFIESTVDYSGICY